VEKLSGLSNSGQLKPSGINMPNVVDISGLSLHKKMLDVIKMCLEYSHNPQIIALAKQLGTPQNAYYYFKQKIRYQLEPKDTLYSPLVTLRRGVADCEDLTTVMGSTALAMGYPIRLVIIANATRHIYPLVRIGGRWIRFDLTPKTEHLPTNYWVVEDVIVYPNGKTVTLDASRETLGDVSGIAKGKWVPITQDTPLNPGDKIAIHLKPKWYLPTWLEGWIYKKIIEHKHPYWRIVKVQKPTEENHEWIVEVEVLKPPTSGLGFLLTAGIIVAGLLTGALLAYMTVTKITKYVPPKTFELGSLGFASIGLAILLASLGKYIPKKKVE